MKYGNSNRDEGEENFNEVHPDVRFPPNFICSFIGFQVAILCSKGGYSEFFL
jgi:hypothetical protein